MKKILLFIFTVTTTISFGQNIFRDDLTAYSSGLALHSQGVWSHNTSSPNGPGTGACVPFSATCGATIEDNAMSYADYGSANKTLSLSPNTDGVGHYITPAVTTGEIYVGMVINISSATVVPASSEPIDFFRVLSGSSFNTAFRMLITPVTGSTFSIGIRKGDTSNVTVNTTATYSYNQDHLVILRYSTLPGANDDELRLYVDPVYASGEPAIPTAISGLPNGLGGDQAGNIDRLAFRQNAGPAGLPTGRVGLISTSTTWQGLTFTLANEQFNKNTFVISSNQVKNGVLNVKSNITLEKARLTIYDMQGRTIATKFISLEETVNDISINPINSVGAYIVEITSENNQRFTQKILVN